MTTRDAAAAEHDAAEQVRYLEADERPRALKVSDALRAFVDRTGRWASWLIVPLIVITVFDVIVRKLVWIQLWLLENFGRIFQSTLLQELEWHFHTALFALVLGYGYIWNTHVRVDLIRENLRSIGLDDRSRVVPCDTFLQVRRIRRDGLAATLHGGDPTYAGRPIDDSRRWTVFCSPPFDFYIDREAEMLALLGDLSALAPAGSIFVAESDRRFDRDHKFVAQLLFTGDEDIRQTCDDVQIGLASEREFLLHRPHRREIPFDQWPIQVVIDLFGAVELKVHLDPSAREPVADQALDGRFERLQFAREPQRNVEKPVIDRFQLDRHGKSGLDDRASPKTCH